MRDDAKNAKLSDGARHWVRRKSSSTSSETTCSISCEHPNPERYGGQRIFVGRREGYAYLVPFPPSPASALRGLRRGLAVALRAEADVEDEHTVFLKTIIPSRKATKEYLGEESDHED
jgi:hypothetical protein